LSRANRDLGVAVAVLESSPPYREATVFHAQQAAEKALKGYLAACGMPFRKTHELPSLVTACERVDPEFSALRAAAVLLTPYAAEFRYPDGPLEPDLVEAPEAVGAAEHVVRFIEARIQLSQPSQTSST
jgi:HEPN domain-containing protein